MAEQVQVGRIRMMFVLETNARTPLPLPLVVQSRKTDRVKLRGPAGTSPTSRDGFVNEKQHHEWHGWHSQPPGGQGMRSEGEPGQGQTGQEECHARVANQAFAP